MRRDANCRSHELTHSRILVAVQNSADEFQCGADCLRAPHIESDRLSVAYAGSLPTPVVMLRFTLSPGPVESDRDTLEWARGTNRRCSGSGFFPSALIEAMSSRRRGRSNTRALRCRRLHIDAAAHSHRPATDGRGGGCRRIVRRFGLAASRLVAFTTMGDIPSPWSTRGHPGRGPARTIIRQRRPHSLDFAWQFVAATGGERAVRGLLPGCLGGNSMGSPPTGMGGLS
jgi:hypothetical protein